MHAPTEAKRLAAHLDLKFAAMEDVIMCAEWLARYAAREWPQGYSVEEGERLAHQFDAAVRRFRNP